MKVLTLYQPWATLVVAGAKKIETRSWKTWHTGDLLIHASTLARPNQFADVFTNWKREFALQLPLYQSLPFGRIIGKVKVSHVVETQYCFSGNEFQHNGHKWTITKQELAFGDYSRGRYGWLLTDPEQFDQPIPAKGSRGLWDFAMCRQCGCWEEDACIHPLHGNCHWVAKDRCSHCANYTGQATRYSKLMAAASSLLTHD